MDTPNTTNADERNSAQIHQGDWVFAKLLTKDAPARKAALSRRANASGGFLLDDPKVQAEIRSGAQRVAYALLPEVCKYLEGAVKGFEPKVTRERNAMAILVLDLVGLRAPAASGDNPDKPLYERSREELLAIVQQAEDATRLLSEKAKPVITSAAKSPGLLE